MKKVWTDRFLKIAIAAAAALALVIAVPALTEAQKKRASTTDPAIVRAEEAIQKLDTRELERLAAELENNLQRVHEEIARKMAELDSLDMSRHVEMAQQAAELAVQQAGSAAELASAELEQKLTRAAREAEVAAQMAGAEVAYRADQAVAWADGQDLGAWVVDSDGDGWLGVNVSEVTAEKAKELKLAAERGVLITDVDAESAAGKAGLKSGDVVTDFNGQRVEGTAQFRRMIRETPAGRSVTLTIWRDAKSQQVTLTLGSQRDRVTTYFRGNVRPLESRNFYMEFPRLQAFSAATPTMGVQIEDLSGQLGSYFGAPDGEGVLVKHVNSGSPAEKAGMKAGDVITRVEGERVRSSSELRTRMRQLREKEQYSITVGVLRKGAETSLKLELQKPETPKAAPKRMKL